VGRGVAGVSHPDAIVVPSRRTGDLMDEDAIAGFTTTLQDAGQFAGRATQEAAATPMLLHHRRQRRVDDWVTAAVTALRDGMREDAQPPVARALLQTEEAVLIDESDGCCSTAWFVERMNDRAKRLPDVWVALAVPDTAPHRVPIADWNPLNRGHGVRVREMRWFVEVRGRRMGLQDGRLLRTGRAALDHSTVRTDGWPEDPPLLRLGRELLHAHPVRRC
jgi:hypothetical protein